MKAIITLAVVIVASIAVSKMLDIKGIDVDTLISGNCAELQRRMIAMDKLSPEDMEQVARCDRNQLARTDSSGSKNKLLGNTRTRPDGALAHYVWLGNLEHFTVYPDRIQIKPTGYPNDVTTIRFENIEKLEDDLRDASGMASGIGITYKNNSGKLKTYAIALYSDEDIGLPKEQTEQGRLYLLLKQQWKK